MRATKHNRYITIVKPTKTENEIGGWSNNYTVPEWSVSVWASVIPIRTYKRMQYAQIGQFVSYEVEMRSRITNADIDCRVTFDGDDYQIVSLEVDRGTAKMDIARIER